MTEIKSNTGGSFEALKEDSLLWQKLKKEAPVWWKNILKDKELYVEIRKDNYANVYFYGGNVALIRCKRDEIVAETHQKYLGDDIPVRVAKRTEHKDGKETEKEINVYEYRNCISKLNENNGLEEVKRHIRETYHDIHGENKLSDTREERDKANNVYTSSEKYVQGLLKLSSPHHYIDSEFAYQMPKSGKERKTIRFDLVELRERTLVFVELKLITDSRLRVEKGKPEIIRQMKAYADFIKEHVQELKNYYAKVLRIKKNIGIEDKEIEIKDIALKPELLVVNTYKGELSPGRINRKKAIENLKSETDFTTNVIDYQDLCK